MAVHLESVRHVSRFDVPVRSFESSLQNDPGQQFRVRRAVDAEIHRATPRIARNLRGLGFTLKK